MSETDEEWTAGMTIQQKANRDQLLYDLDRTEADLAELRQGVKEIASFLRMTVEYSPSLAVGALTEGAKQLTELLARLEAKP